MNILLDKIMYEKNLSVRQVSIMTGVSKSAIANYEQGTRAPNLEALKELATHYGVSVDYLLRAYIAEAVPVAKKERASQERLYHWHDEYC